MKNKYFLISLLCLFLSQSDIYADDEVALAYLMADFAAFTRPTKREIHLFNHRNSRQLDLQDKDMTNLKSPKVIQYAKSRAARATRRYNSRGMMVGEGLYASSDPYSSGDYGGGFYAKFTGADWAMVRIKIPKETVLFDLRAPNSRGHYIPVSLQTLKYLETDCPSLKFEPSLITKIRVRAETNPQRPRRPGEFKDFAFIHKDDLTANKYCSQLFNNAMKELNIGAIVYRWDGTNPTDDCDTKSNNDDAAFVIINSPLNRDTVDLFTPDVAKNLTLEQEQKYRNVAYTARRHGKVNFFKSSVYGEDKVRWDKFKDLGKKAAPGSKEHRYLTQTKFGCAAKYDKDDSFQYHPDKSVKIYIDYIHSKMQKMTDQKIKPDCFFKFR